ncbi:ATP-binding protein [Pseudomonas sp. PDM23]|uniref:AAA family ATPase n=1 Tax=unclassified Pseudomonas TaxID=196821 RepID=UPI0017806C35|nr:MULTISPECIES: AAA family ATPase [unclassified Pseudomonas]MBD9573691.1 ATP-binding protein [Pseudomonas sp. PDM23]MBD9675006.1 ATP-binding protein [Pseudomonas sp. PDM21]
MIRSFDFLGRTICLARSDILNSSGANLFNSDSMTLIVGQNGAGKTRALASLASLFQEGKRGDAEIKVEWDCDTDFDETCVIYYTPVPFQVDVPKKGSSLRAVQPTYASEHLRADRYYEVAKDLEHDFGLDARRVLELPALSGTVVSELMGRALSSRYNVIDQWVAPLRARYSEYHERVSEMRRREGYYRSPEYKAISAEFDELRKDFAVGLRRNLNEGFSLKLRAYQSARSGRAPSERAEKELLEKLGFTLSSYKEGSPTVPRKKFEAVLSQLNLIADIVNDSGLARRAYEVDERQVDQLNALSLAESFKISLRGVSSGAAALIHQFSSINIACEELLKEGDKSSLLLLIDEGDAFLHLGWQQKYVDYLDRVVQRLKQRFKSVQVVMTSHSPFLMSDFPSENIAILSGQDWVENFLEGDSNTVILPSFGAPLDAVVRHVAQSGTMGLFATRIIRELAKDISRGSEVDVRRIDMIGDPVIKRQMSRMLQGRGSRVVGGQDAS